MVGHVVSGTIENCTNTGTVTAKYQADASNSGLFSGGIVGYMEGATIKESSNSGEIISETQDAGGIAGYVLLGTIENCTNKGKVTAKYQADQSFPGIYSGGIVGYMKGATIKECSNSGEVIAEFQGAGGIVGCMNTGGTIENCTNTGTITAKYQSGASNSGLFSGGIVGWMLGGTIKECSNSGEIIAEESCAGGITGRSKGTVSECINTGNIKLKPTIVGDGTYSNKAGGISGDNQGGTIEYCYNKGTVESSKVEGTIDEIGGIAGLNRNNGTIKYCYNEGSLEGGDTQGGVVGQLYNGTLLKNYYYSENISTAIGHNGTSYTGITPGSDISGQAEKIEASEANGITDFNSFWNWIQTK